MLVNLFLILVPIALQNVQGRYRRMRKRKSSYTKNTFLFMLIDKIFVSYIKISSLGSEFPKRKDIKIIDTKYVFYGLVSPQIFRNHPPPRGYVFTDDSKCIQIYNKLKRY